MKPAVKKVLTYLAVLLALLAAYLLFSFVACVVPTTPVRNHVAQTFDNGDFVRDYPREGMMEDRCRSDNFTDALILSQAYYIDNDNYRRSMLLVPYASAEPGNVNVMTENLRRLVKGESGVVEKNYPRYWHGSAFLMRFLLQFSDYLELRLFFYIVSSLLMLSVMIRVARKVSVWVSLMCLLSFLFVNVFITQFSIQFLPVLLITLSAMGLVCCNRLDKPLLFFVTGSVTSFFDILTTPLLTLGMPLALLLLLIYKERDDRWLSGFGTMASTSVAWSVGFFLTWFLKWVIATLFTAENVILDGFNAFLYRSGGMEDYTRGDAVVENFNMLPWPLVIALLSILVVLAIVRFNKQGWKVATLLLLLGCMPCLWYLFVANHSYLHWWFTYRLQAVTLFSILTAVGSMVDWSRWRELLSKVSCKRKLIENQ